MTRLDALAHRIRTGAATAEELAALSDANRTAILNDKDAEWRLSIGRALDPAPSDDRRIKCVASTEFACGPFDDVLLVDGWDMARFEQTGSPLLYGHNIDEELPPIGRVTMTEKGEYRSAPALLAETEYMPADLNPFADMIYRMTAANWMPNYSVRFRIKAWRQPTADERKQRQMGPHGRIATHTEMHELSAVPVPEDPGCNVVRSAAMTLARGIGEAGYEPDTVREFARQYGHGLLPVLARIVPTVGRSVHAVAKVEEQAERLTATGERLTEAEQQISDLRAQVDTLRAAVALTGDAPSGDGTQSPSVESSSATQGEQDSVYELGWSANDRAALRDGLRSAFASPGVST